MLQDIPGWSNVYLCVGLQHHGKVINEEHFTFDPLQQHYSAGLCKTCLNLKFKYRAIDKYLKELWDCHGV